VDGLAVAIGLAIGLVAGLAVGLVAGLVGADGGVLAAEAGPPVGGELVPAADEQATVQAAKPSPNAAARAPRRGRWKGRFTARSLHGLFMHV
jgi:hypothetical protein